MGNEAITFNHDQTSKYSSNYNSASVNRIDVIDVASQEYSQEDLGYVLDMVSGDPTPLSHSIIYDSSISLTLVEESDSILEEFENYLIIDSFLSGIDDTESDIISDSSSFLTLIEESDSIMDMMGDYINLDSFIPGIHDSEIDEEGDINDFLEQLLYPDNYKSVENCYNILPPKQLHKEKSKSVEKTDKIPEIKHKTSPPSLKFQILEEEVLVLTAILISLLPFTYPVISPSLHSFGSEDVTFDPGIFHITLV